MGINELKYVLCDVAESGQLGLQDPATPIMEGIINFHNHLMVFLVVIGGLVVWLLLFFVFCFIPGGDNMLILGVYHVLVYAFSSWGNKKKDGRNKNMSGV